MTRAKRKRRTFWIVESEYGWDIKRYVVSVHRSQLEAVHFCNYLNEKNPHDKHEIFEVDEKLARRKK